MSRSSRTAEARRRPSGFAAQAAWTGFPLYEARGFAQLAMAWSGDGFALVWCPGLSSGPVSAVLLDREGKPTGPPISLAEDGSGCYPAVAFDGTAYVVAWSREASSVVHFVRWDDDGSPPGPVVEWPTFGADREARSPRLSVHDGSTMVAFVDAPTDGGASDWSAWVRWQPFDPVLLQATGEARSLARARIIPFDLAVGDSFAILASLRVGEHSCDSGTLYSAPLSDSGELLDAPVPIQCPRTCDDCWIEPPITMSMAWGLGGWTVAFRHLAYGAVLVRTDARGTAVQAQTLDAWGEYEWPIEVAFDGEGFGVLELDDTGPVFSRYVVEP